MTHEINVFVRVFAAIRESIGTKSVELTINEPWTVITVIEKLLSNFPRIEPLLMNGGSVSPNFVIALNSKMVDHNQLSTTEVKSNDEIALVPPAGGG